MKAMIHTVGIHKEIRGGWIFFACLFSVSLFAHAGSIKPPNGDDFDPFPDNIPL